LGNASRIIYTTPDNHWIGVSQAADIDGINAWYEKKDRTYYIENQFKLGYQYAHCDLQVVSYGAAS
jgi:antibiotic biosynthesis monooxygenase (ABM) superfamily enzyme